MFHSSSSPACRPGLQSYAPPALLSALPGMSNLQDNYLRVHERIHNAALRAGRNPSDIKLIAVTKTVPVESIREAAGCGILHIGENRFQEALPKREGLRDLNL